MTRRSAQRRLATILAADVVGYSRLMGADEEGTLTTLRSYREVIDGLVAGGEGRIFASAGDSVIAEFASPVEAVRCADEFQREIDTRNTELAEQQRMRFRVGIHLGDVIVEGANLLGDSVNVAARLEALAQPGGICISEDVFRQIRGKTRLEWEAMGQQRLKNIKEPIEAFQTTLTETKATTDAEVHGQPEKPSIAVLPFTNLGGDPEQEYFADGIIEDIITELSRFRELQVVSRNSSFAFKGQSVPGAAIAEKLRVNYVVEGSIRKAGNRVRVTAQLIDARADKHIWADKYDRLLEDIFAVQDDVVKRVTSTLVHRLEQQRSERVRRLAPEELQAYDLYLRGRDHMIRSGREDNERARALLEAAIKINPAYAAAHALLCEVHMRAWINCFSDTPEAHRDEAYRSAQAAADLDEQDSRVQTAVAITSAYQRNYDKARFCLDQALRLNPNDTRAMIQSSVLASIEGRHADALAQARQALQLDPYAKYHWNLGNAHFCARQYAEAAEALSRMHSQSLMICAITAATLALAERNDEAAVARDQFLAIAQSTPATKDFARTHWRQFFADRRPFRDPGDLAHLFEGLERLDCRSSDDETTRRLPVPAADSRSQSPAPGRV